MEHLNAWADAHPDVAWWLVFLMVVVVLAIPCKYDPAIRLKEWTEGWHKK